MKGNPTLAGVCVLKMPPTGSWAESHLNLELADALVVALGGVPQRAHCGGVAVRQVLRSIRRPDARQLQLRP